MTEDCAGHATVEDHSRCFREPTIFPRMAVSTFGPRGHLICSVATSDARDGSAPDA